MPCEGFLLGSFCLCSGEWSWILTFWRTVPCPIKCSGMSVGLAWLWVTCLLMGMVEFLFCWSVWHWSLLAFECVLVLVLRWRLWGELSLINVPWVWEFSGDTKSWTWISHLKDLGPTPYCSRNISQATQHRRQNPKSDVQSNAQQPRIPKETQIHAKRSEWGKIGKKKDKNDQKRREQSSQ